MKSQTMHLDDLRQALCTIVAVPITPFDLNGQIDFQVYHRLIARLTATGITAVTVNGNTGEFYSLSIAECSSALEAAMDAATSQTVIVAGIGYDVATAVHMGETARDKGANALMVHQIVHPYRSSEGWTAYHRAIAAVVPELGVVPYVRDSQVTPAMLKGLLDACPNVVGVKYAVPDPLWFAQMVKEVGVDRLAWICGLAEGWAPFFWVGGSRGFTSGLVNVHATLSVELFHRLEHGDYAGAMQVWAQLKPFEDLRARRNGGNNVSVIKEALAQMGLTTRVVRPPISEIPESERLEVANILSAWKLLTPVVA